MTTRRGFIGTLAALATAAILPFKARASGISHRLPWSERLRKQDESFDWKSYQKRLKAEREKEAAMGCKSIMRLRSRQVGDVAYIEYSNSFSGDDWCLLLSGAPCPVPEFDPSLFSKTRAPGHEFDSGTLAG
jgi:hypothetical protein